MTKKPLFSNSYDAALFTCAVLRRFNAGNINSFEQRFISQKIQYFAQLFRISPPYSFNLYIRGPYSPDLTNDLFQIKEHEIRVPKIDKFTPQELEGRFLRLKKFVGGKSNRELELIATLDWLVRIAKMSQGMVKEKLNKIKGASPTEINFTIKWTQNLWQQISKT